MQVLMLSWEYHPDIAGGLGRHVSELAPALVQQGVQVDVITPLANPLPHSYFDQAASKVEFLTPELTVSTEAGVRIHRIMVPSQDMAPDIYERVSRVGPVLTAYVTRLNEVEGTRSILHCHDWLTGFASTALQADLGYPLVVTIHATERGRARGYLMSHLQRNIDRAEQTLIHQANRVIVCSRYMSTELHNFFDIPVETMSVVPNGVDIAGLSVIEGVNPAEFRARYVGPNDKLVFSVSRLVHEKGIHRLVEAVPLIQHECPNVCLVVAGRGPEAEHLQDLARALGIAERVSFIGFISDEARNLLFKVADCAVFPSLYEPFGIVALEAMALGCPVVASDVGGLSEVVTYRDTGITIYPDDPHSVAWGVIRALTEPDWVQEHIVRARQRVKEEFNWGRIARQTINVYEQVLRLTA
jgi:1,4-alpha-glucan branching enzyme